MSTLEAQDSAHDDYVTKESDRLAVLSEMGQVRHEEALKPKPPQSPSRRLQAIEAEPPKKKLDDGAIIETLKTIHKLLKSKDPKDGSLAARKIKDLSQDTGYARELIERLASSLDEQDDNIDAFRAKIAQLLQK